MNGNFIISERKAAQQNFTNKLLPHREQTKWLRFYIRTLMMCWIVFGSITAFRDLTYANLTSAVIASVLHFAIVGLTIITRAELYRFTQKGYKLNRLLLILVVLVNIVIGLLGSSEEVFFSSLSAAILFFISFTIPNLIYFRRRKFLFGFSDEKTVEKIENECIEPIIETTLKEDNQPCFHENTIKTSKQKFCKLRARLIKAFKFLGIFTVLALAVTLIFAIPAINANVNEDREYIGERADDYGGKERLTLHTKTCAMLPFIENKESVTGEKAMEFYYLANHESVNTSFCHLCNPKKPSFKQLKKLSSDYSSEFQELSQHSEQWKKLVKYKTTIEYSDEYIKRIYKINPPPAALLDKNSDAWSRIKAEIEHSQRAAELKEEYQQIFDEIYNKKPFDTEITPENIRFAQEKINRMENIKRYANSLETKTRNGALLYAISTWLSIEA